jgi:hypothetical protein
VVGADDDGVVYFSHHCPHVSISSSSNPFVTKGLRKELMLTGGSDLLAGPKPFHLEEFLPISEVSLYFLGSILL